MQHSSHAVDEDNISDDFVSSETANPAQLDEFISRQCRLNIIGKVDRSSGSAAVVRDGVSILACHLSYERGPQSK